MKLPGFLISLIVAAGTVVFAAQDKHPVISFESQAHDAGKVTEGETIKHVFKFTNKGDAILEIFKVEPS